MPGAWDERKHNLVQDVQLDTAGVPESLQQQCNCEIRHKKSCAPQERQKERHKWH